MDICFARNRIVLNASEVKCGQVQVGIYIAMVDYSIGMSNAF